MPRRHLTCGTRFPSRPSRRATSLALVAGCLAVFCTGSPLVAQSGSFGHSVTVASDEILVAEPTTSFRPGSVHVYRKAGEGWREFAVLRAPQPKLADGFGTDLAVTGDVLFVGQRGGPVHVFARADGEWRASASIDGPGTDGLSPSCSFDGYCGTDFGIALAAHGDWLMVGAPGPAGARRGADASDRAGGKVYAYRADREEGELRWLPAGELVPASGRPDDRFGAAMAFTSHGLLVAAPGWGDESSVAGAGSVYHYRLEDDVWSQYDVLETTPVANANFGSALAADDERVLVGAPGLDDNRGAAFLWRWSLELDRWLPETRRLQLAEGESGDRFGAAVALAGSDLWVGSPTERGEETGAVFVYEAEPDGTLSDEPRLLQLPEAGTVERDRFGGLIVGNLDVVAVGAPGMHHRAGSVHLFERSAESDGRWAEAGHLLSDPDALAPMLGEERRCVNGKIGPFDCEEVELLAYLPGSILTARGAARGVRLNDNWGWTDPATGGEYALVGRNDGMSFVDVTDPANPVLVGDLPKTPGTPPSQLWRDVKTHDDHAFIVADGAGDHGMQVFDLGRLRTVAPAEMPVVFEPDVHYTGVASSHNIVVNEETGFAYAVGSGSGGESCGGGLHMIDVRDPRNPEFVGCFQDEGGTHDSQCVVYAGPDSRYAGRELCLNSNGSHFQIVDVTDKSDPLAIARATSPNAAYIHQGWLTPDHRYFYQDDESDVIAGAVETTRTLIWDLSDLEDPILAREFMGSLPASAHNLYVKDGFVYQANYRYGLHVLDISDPLNPREAGTFDTAPHSDGPGFGGAWSVYPFFESGTLIVTSMQEGLFVLRKRRPVS